MIKYVPKELAAWRKAQKKVKPLVALDADHQERLAGLYNRAELLKSELESIAEDIEIENEAYVTKKTAIYEYVWGKGNK
jgi:hypothetical protein